MKKPTTFLAGALLAMFTLGSAHGATLILGDDFNVVNSGTGFNLNKGVNSGINPPVTRLTGTAAADLRYIKSGTRSGGLHYITNNSTLAILPGGNHTFVSLSPDGTGVFDFGPALQTSQANKFFPVEYEVSFDLGNFQESAAATPRVGFGIRSGTTEWGLPQTWDFGVEVFQNAPTDTGYTLQVRIKGGSRGSSDALTKILDSQIGTDGTPLSLVFKVKDAGAESGTGLNSRVQLGLVEGGVTNILYDTAADSQDMPLGFRFTDTERRCYIFVAGQSATTGYAAYDNISITSLSGAPEQNVRTWTGGGANDNWSTPANWDGPVPVNDSLVFAGSARQVNLNDLTTFYAPWVRLDNGGFQLGGNTLNIGSAITNVGNNTLALPVELLGNGLKQWSLAAGGTLTLTAPFTCPMDGDHRMSGGGDLHVKANFTLGADSNFEVREGRLIFDNISVDVEEGGFRLGSYADSTIPSELLLTNTTFNLLASGMNIRVGDSSRPALNRLVMQDSSVYVESGNVHIPYAAGATGEVLQIGGIVSGPIIDFSRLEGSGVYTVINGILEVGQIRKTKVGGYAEMHFANTILRTAIGNATDFLGGLDVASIVSGDLILDVTQNDVVIAQPLAGAGGLRKMGGMATLTGMNTFTGPLVVENGTLRVFTGQTYGNMVVRDYSTLRAGFSAPNATLSGTGLTLGTATLEVDLSAAANPTVAPITVSSLAVNGDVTINLSGGTGLDVGQFPLINYTSRSGAGSFVLGTPPAGVTASLVTNVANTSIDLLISTVPGLNWVGNFNENWDYTTSNWLSTETGSATVYSDNVPTRFKDSAAQGNVVLTTPVYPGAVVVDNNDLAYVFSGAGPLVASQGFIKEGTNSLTRVDGMGDNIPEIILNNGLLVITNSTDATFLSSLDDTGTGLGTLVKNDPYVLTLSMDSTNFSGSFLVQAGTLRFGADNCVGSPTGAVTVVSGASLDVNNLANPHKPIVVSGAGVSGQGAIVNNAAGGGVQNNLTDVTMVGHTTFGCVAGSRWDIRVRDKTGPGPGLRGNGFNFTKVGGGALAISSQRMLGSATPYWEMNLGDILIQEGSIAFEEAISLGNPEKALVLMPGTTMNLFNLGVTNPIVRNITVTDANLTGGGNNHTNVVDGDISLTGSITMRVNGAYYIVNGDISGNASVQIGLINSGSAPGHIILNGANTYTGDTTVTNSTLAGNGSIAGNLIVNGGGLAPGFGVGTFSVAGNASLGGTTTMELAPGQVPNSDRLSVGGTITAGGTLTLVLAENASGFAAGDLFQIFNKAVDGTFANVNLPVLPVGLKWNNTIAANGAISVVPTAPPSIGDVSVSGGTFTFSGTGGAEGGTYYIVTSPDVAAPMNTWVPVATNTFGAGGTFSFSTNVVGGQPEAFFRLQLP